MLKKMASAVPPGNHQGFLLFVNVFQRNIQEALSWLHVKENLHLNSHIYKVLFEIELWITKREKENIALRLTLLYSQLSHRRHANHYGHLIRDIHICFLFKSIVPCSIVYVW